MSVEQLKQAIQESIELLSEVIEKRGAYSTNHMEHAENVIENASERAKKATDILKEAIKGLDGLVAKHAKTSEEIALDYNMRGQYLFQEHPPIYAKITEICEKKWIAVDELKTPKGEPEGKESVEP